MDWLLAEWDEERDMSPRRREPTGGGYETETQIALEKMKTFAICKPIGTIRPSRVSGQCPTVCGRLTLAPKGI